MLLAVAGASQREIDERTRLITTGSWEAFRPAEQAAFAFAYRMTKSPSQLEPIDSEVIKSAFGDARSIDLIWYVAWCNYMTRVADALQLPLESTNVFQP